MTGNGRTAWRLSLSLQLVSLLPLLLALLACGRTSPLETKEALVAWAVLLCAGLWLGLRLEWGQFRWISSPVDLPLLALWLLAGMSLLFHRDGWLLRFRDFSLFSLLLVYGKILAAVLTDPRWRALVLRLAVGAIAVVALIALMMDRGIYFWIFHPVELSTENARHTIVSTIGHNGSVASLMMAGVFYALALLKMSRRKGEQYLTCGCVVLFLYIIIASRTVAVWLILPLLILFFGWGLWKSSQDRADGEVRFRARRWVAALLFSILLLGTVATWLAPDPLSTPLARFQRLQPKVLMQGTRLRLWRVGLEMIREQPLGVGFAGFKLNYPQYQGLYFERHPDSELRPTSLRSGRAHNEYLQLVIELGLLGGVVLVWLLACFVKWAWFILRLRYGPPFAVRLSILLAMLGVLLHNLVTFEFHVISSAVLFLFSWAWLSSLNSQHRLENEAGIQQFSTQLSNSPQNISTHRKRWGTHKVPSPLCGGGLGWGGNPSGQTYHFKFFLIGVCLVSAWLGALALQVGHVASFQAEELFRQGHLERRKGFKQGISGQLQAQIESYRQASRMLESAYSLAPYRGDFAYYAGWCYLETGRLFSATHKSLLAEKSLQSALQWFDRAEATFSGSIFERDRADAHYLLGMLEEGRSGSGQSSFHLSKAESELKKAAWINPHDTELPYLLGQYYESIGDVTRSRQTWQNAAVELPEIIDERLFPQVLHLSQEGQDKQAWDVCWMILEASPAHILSWWQAERLAFKLGPEYRAQFEKRLLSALAHTPEPDPHLLMTRALFSYKEGKYTEAEQYADLVLDCLPRNVNALLMKCAILEQTGRRGQVVEILRERQKSIRKLNAQNWRLVEKLAILLSEEKSPQSAVEFLDHWREDDRFKSAEETFETQWAQLRQQVLQTSY